MLEEFGIPKSYEEELRLFKDNGLEYVLFKQTLLVNKSIDGLDILFKNKDDMIKAKLLLVEKGFTVSYSERSEPFKIMMVKITDDGLKTFHLHRKVAWDGLEVLNTHFLFKRSEVVNELLRIPSKEDSLLIHTAHALFEEHILSKDYVQFIKTLLKQKIDWDYINYQLVNNGWIKGFYKLLETVKSCEVSDLKLDSAFVLKVRWSKFFGRGMIGNLLSLCKQFFWSMCRRANLSSRGFLVALIGVNGTGKTTLTSKLIDFFKKNDPLNKASIYYFGWAPSFPITRLISSKSRRKIETDDREKKMSSSRASFSILYEFFEYLWRYVTYVYPLLRKDYLVFSDRYFYDLAGQHVESRKSRLVSILIRLFPRPDRVFLLLQFGVP
jgi:hypothetical protein